MTAKHLQPASGIWERVRSGALGGAVMGGLMLGVGLIRALVVLLSGGSVSTSPLRDLALGLLYVVGFATAGGVLGALWPLRVTRFGAYLLGYIAAGIFCGVCGIIVMRLENDSDPVKFAVITGIMTLVFGTVAGYHIRRAD